VGRLRGVCYGSLQDCNRFLQYRELFLGGLAVAAVNDIMMKRCKFKIVAITLVSQRLKYVSASTARKFWHSHAKLIVVHITTCFKALVI